MAQLMAGLDDAAGGAEGGPVQVSALLAHLLLLRAAGGLANATCLPDTFGEHLFHCILMMLPRIGRFLWY